MLVAVGASVWLGFFVSRNVDYQTMLWWDFAYSGDAPRFLRATLGIGVVGLMFAVHRVLHSAHPGDATSGRDLALIRPIVAKATRTDVQLSFLGDKKFLFAENGRGFVMYSVQGPTWLAMGEPVAEDEETTAELIWRFKELADLHNGAPAFYQLSWRYIPLYIDAGFSLAKLGEDAFVELASSPCKVRRDANGGRAKSPPSAVASLSTLFPPSVCPRSCRCLRRCPMPGSPIAAERKRASRSVSGRSLTCAATTTRWSGTATGSSHSPISGRRRSKANTPSI